MPTVSAASPESRHVHHPIPSTGNKSGWEMGRECASRTMFRGGGWSCGIAGEVLVWVVGRPL